MMPENDADANIQKKNKKTRQKGGFFKCIKYFFIATVYYTAFPPQTWLVRKIHTHPISEI